MSDDTSVNQDSLHRWLDELQDGRSRATERLWNLYFERMVAVARKKLAGARCGARDEEDVALSAFKSFCLDLQQRRRQLSRDDVDLWPLLVTITINKAVDYIRSENRTKRGGGRFHSLEGADAIEQFASCQQSPALEALATDLFEKLLSQLDACGDQTLSEIVARKLVGASNEEIALELKCTLRTVQRKLKTARSVWESVCQ